MANLSLFIRDEMAWELNYPDNVESLELGWTDYIMDDHESNEIKVPYIANITFRKENEDENLPQ